MRRAVLLLAMMTVALLVASGVALAINTIQCKTTTSVSTVCYGTKRADLMKGTDRYNEMYGRGAADTLKGFGSGDNLDGGGGNDRVLGGPGNDGVYGDEGDDRLVGGPGQDGLWGFGGDDTLKGGDGSDDYGFTSAFGNDTIVDTVISDNDFFTGNTVVFSYKYVYDGLVINLNSDSGPAPELADGTDTANWSGNVVDNVDNDSLNSDDRIVGNDAANLLLSRGGAQDGNPDSDTVSAQGGDDRIVVRDGDANDTVACGAGTDTVIFDEGDELVVPADCEEQHSEEPTPPQ